MQALRRHHKSTGHQRNTPDHELLAQSPEFRWFEGPPADSDSEEELDPWSVDFPGVTDFEKTLRKTTWVSAGYQMSRKDYDLQKILKDIEKTWHDIKGENKKTKHLERQRKQNKNELDFRMKQLMN